MLLGDRGGHDGLTRFLSPAAGLWAHDRPDLLPPAGSPMVASDVCVAAIRRLAGIPGPSEIPRVLAQDPGRAASLRHGRALPAYSAGRDSCRRRRVPAALIGASFVAGGSVAKSRTTVPDYAPAWRALHPGHVAGTSFTHVRRTASWSPSQ